MRTIYSPSSRPRWQVEIEPEQTATGAARGAELVGVFSGITYFPVFWFAQK